MEPFDHGVVRLTFDLGPHQLAIGLQNMGNYDPLTGDRVSVYHAVDVDNKGFVYIAGSDGPNKLIVKYNVTDGGYVYNITGDLDEPDVSVNPIKTITPGFIQKFFSVFKVDKKEKEEKEN